MPAEIPEDSPLGTMLANWDVDSSTREKEKVKMIQFCMIEWAKTEIRSDHVYWPRYGSFEAWICQALNTFVNSKEPVNPEEKEYAACWIGDRKPPEVKVFKISETQKKEKNWDPLEMLPPPFSPGPAPFGAALHVPAPEPRAPPGLEFPFPAPAALPAVTPPAALGLPPAQPTLASAPGTLSPSPPPTAPLPPAFMAKAPAAPLQPAPPAMAPAPAATLAAPAAPLPPAHPTAPPAAPFPAGPGPAVLDPAAPAAMTHAAVRAPVWVPEGSALSAVPVAVPAHTPSPALEDSDTEGTPASVTVPLATMDTAVQGTSSFKGEAPYQNTRSSVKRQTFSDTSPKLEKSDIRDSKQKDWGEKIHLFPLREVPMGGGGNGIR